MRILPPGDGGKTPQGSTYHNRGEPFVSIDVSTSIENKSDISNMASIEGNKISVRSARSSAKKTGPRRDLHTIRKTLVQLIQQITPDFLKRLRRQVILDRAVRRISLLGEGEIPSHEILERLRYGWGNTTTSACVEYLEEMYCQAIEKKGPVLECGSGVTTLLLGLVANKQPDTEVWSFEHSPKWRARIKEALNRYQIQGVKVFHTPLRDFGQYSWYDLPPDPMPEDFRLVVCDGPLGSTPGGRYGLFPNIAANMAPDCTVLLDDAGREGEKQVLERWKDEYDITLALHGREHLFALITFN